MGSTAGRNKAVIVPALPAAGGFGRELANWMFPGFMAVVLAGFCAIRWWGMQPANDNGVRALFISLNCATLTGFRMGAGVGGLEIAGQWVALLLIICGSLFTMIVGSLAVARIARLPLTDGQIIRGALLTEALVLAIGTWLLYHGTRTPFQAIFLSASAFGNCGVVPFNIPHDADTDPFIHLVVMPLTILGGLGLPVLMESARAIFHWKPMSGYSRTVLAWTAWIYVIAMVLFVSFHAIGGELNNWEDFRRVTRQSSILVIQSRTGGLNYVSVDNATTIGQWLLLVLMAIGASSAGTGSGLKTSTLAALYNGVRRLFSGQTPGRSMGVAVVWVGLYFAMVLAAAILIESVSANAGDVLFNAVSALSNVGFSSLEIAEEKNLMFAYCSLMLLGRMMPLMILWWMADTVTEADIPVG